MLDAFLPTPTLMMVRFRRWDDLLNSPTPDSKLGATTALWHFGRAMAYASTGKTDSAEKERTLLVSMIKAFPKDLPYGFNTAADVFSVVENVLSARIALARNDKQAAVGFFKKAIGVEDSLNYDEPEDWYMPVRESLGGLLIINGSYSEAEGVFRAELKKHPRNGRALFGLVESLKKQNKTAAAQFVQREFEEAWKNADIKLRIEDL
jgi:tetratricopeptide (TPR) repeat protein